MTNSIILKFGSPDLSNQILFSRVANIHDPPFEPAAFYLQVLLLSVLQVGLLLGLEVLEVLFLFGQPLLLFFLGC